MSKPRVMVWYSCGAASAVAAKVAIERWRGELPVEVCYCDTSADEHHDNARFTREVEDWIGQKVVTLRSNKYRNIYDVFMGERFIVGPKGAPCTRILKRHAREAYQRPDDIHVMGFTADEAGRIKAFEARYSELTCRPVLAEGGITKDDCYRIVQAAGIELPEMYRLGYKNNNCIGCVKGGMGYWNKIRIDFPNRFRKMARIEREIGATVLKRGENERLYLDELDPTAGRYGDEPDIECGLFCDSHLDLIALTDPPEGETK